MGRRLTGSSTRASSGLTSLMWIWIMMMPLRKKLTKKHPWRLTRHLSLQRQLKPMKLTYEKYKKMSFLLIDYIKNQEETLEASGGGDSDNTPKRSDVVNWYLGE